MNIRTQEQLDKVLALADSSHEGEAVVAVRKARQMLSRDGLNFSDLARAAVSQRPRINLPFSIFAPQTPALDPQIHQLRQHIEDLQAEVQSQTTQAEFWRRRAAELEQQLKTSTEQSTRWRDLAKETVDKLWDLGQSIKLEEFDAGATPASPTPVRAKSAEIKSA